MFTGIVPGTSSNRRHSGTSFRFWLIPSVAREANGPIMSKIDAHLSLLYVEISSDC